MSKISSYSQEKFPKISVHPLQLFQFLEYYHPKKKSDDQGSYSTYYGREFSSNERAPTKIHDLPKVRSLGRKKWIKYEENLKVLLKCHWHNFGHAFYWSVVVGKKSQLHRQKHQKNSSR